MTPEELESLQAQLKARRPQRAVRQ